jgi:hypothetical protein
VYVPVTAHAPEVALTTSARYRPYVPTAHTTLPAALTSMSEMPSAVATNRLGLNTVSGTEPALYILLGRRLTESPPQTPNSCCDRTTNL